MPLGGLSDAACGLGAWLLHIDSQAYTSVTVAWGIQKTLDSPVNSPANSPAWRISRQTPALFLPPTRPPGESSAQLPPCFSRQLSRLANLPPNLRPFSPAPIMYLSSTRHLPLCLSTWFLCIHTFRVGEAARYVYSRSPVALRMTPICLWPPCRSPCRTV